MVVMSAVAVTPIRQMVKLQANFLIATTLHAKRGDFKPDAQPSTSDKDGWCSP